MFKNDCCFVNSADGPVHAITFFVTLGTHGAYKTFKLFSLLCISDIFRLYWAIAATIVLMKELEQFYRRLKTKTGLDKTLTLGSAIAVHPAPPSQRSSYQVMRELLIFEVVLHLTEAIWIVIYLTFHSLSALFTSLMGNSKQTRNRPAPGRLDNSMLELKTVRQ